MAEEVVVTDAGPVLHLHWVHATEWGFPAGPVVVVETVWREVERHDPKALADSRFHRKSDPLNLVPELNRPGLDPGERAALAYALEAALTADVQVLSDDTEARAACRDLGIPYTGTIGLILEAYAAARVDYASAASALTALPVTGGLWVHPRLLQQALAALDSPRSTDE